MKTLYSLILLLVSTTLGAWAQADGDYYLDLLKTNEKYYFTWDASLGLYTLSLDQLHGDFKIYNKDYSTTNNDNKYIFGASQEGQNSGVTADSEKRLANPGVNMQVEGGGYLYNVVLQFNPTAMTLKIVGGATTNPDAEELTPILIGQLAQGSWKPNVGVEPTINTAEYNGKTIKVYRFEANLVDKGEFSFVTKLGTSENDWGTVNSSPRYAPSSNRVTAPMNTWEPFTEYTNGTSNAWVPANFTPEYYEIYFTYENLGTSDGNILIRSGFNPTSIEEVNFDTPKAVDVYNLQGVLLRHNVSSDDALTGLPAGMYISGGKKVAVR